MTPPQPERFWPSRYGSADRRGSGNELTAERTLAALRIPVRGEVIELGQVLDERAPAVAPRRWHQLVLAHESLDAMVRERSPNRVSFMDEHSAGSHHLGCHLDGLGHVGIDGHFYNGLHYTDIYGPTGLAQLGIESVRPWVSRGVCLDVAAVAGVDHLPQGWLIGPEHLAAAERRQAVEVRTGDAVLLHTGWATLWDEDPDRYAAAEPGPGVAAAEWLTDRRVSLVGADNWGLEVVPPESPDRFFAVHQHLLARTGTHILENIDTRPLVDGGHAEFLFVLSVPKTRGSTAAPAAPLAIV
jgi:kynurenine formamidase